MPDIEHYLNQYQTKIITQLRNILIQIYLENI